MAVFKPTLGGQILKYDMSKSDYIAQQNPVMSGGSIGFHLPNHTPSP